MYLALCIMQLTILIKEFSMSIADKDIDDAIDEAETQHELLTDWENEPSVVDLKLDLEEARESHDTHVSEVTAWLDNMHIRGKAVPKTKEGYSKIAPKTIRKNNEWKYSSLSEPFLSTDDVFNTAPATYEDTEAAVQNGIILNHQFNNVIDKQAFVDELVRVFVDEGTAVVRVGWQFEEVDITTTEDIYEFYITTDPAIFVRNQRMAQIRTANPNAYQMLPDKDIQAFEYFEATGQLVTAEVIGEEEVTTTKIIHDRPVLDICNYNNTIIDPSANGDIDKARFVIHSFKTTYSELSKDAKYKNLDRVNFDENSPDNDPDYSEDNAADNESTTFSLKDKPRKEVVAYEYWGVRDLDGSGETRSFVATWIGNTMIHMEENPNADQSFPFVVIPYMPIKGDNYGEPDGALLIDNQKIIGATTRAMVDVMARGANGQKGMRKGALDATNRRKFKRGDDYDFNGNVDAQSLVYMHKFDELPQSASIMLSMQQAEVESMSGTKAFANGITGQALGDTVGGQKHAMDAASKREMGVLRRLASGFIKIGRKMAAMNAEFLNEEQVIRITNNEFVKIRKDDLAGKIDIKLSISTPEEDDAKASALSFQLQTLAPTVDFSITKILMIQQARLQKMPELAKALEEYEPKPDPIQQELQMLEIQIKKAELALLMGGDKGVAQLNAAKTVTEGFKAKKTMAEADQIELNTVEQEEGVTQERAKEMAKEQSKGNVNLEVVKKMLDSNDKDDNNAPKTTK